MGTGGFNLFVNPGADLRFDWRLKHLHANSNIHLHAYLNPNAYDYPKQHPNLYLDDDTHPNIHSDIDLVTHTYSYRYVYLHPDINPNFYGDRNRDGFIYGHAFDNPFENFNRNLNLKPIGHGYLDFDDSIHPHLHQ